MLKQSVFPHLNQINSDNFMQEIIDIVHITVILNTLFQFNIRSQYVSKLSNIN
jgi:hypothetical protein